MKTVRRWDPHSKTIADILTNTRKLRGFSWGGTLEVYGDDPVSNLDRREAPGQNCGFRIVKEYDESRQGKRRLPMYRGRPYGVHKLFIEKVDSGRMHPDNTNGMLGFRVVVEADP
jgi:hypothetical protein